jgi:uncharacterized protein (TIGR03435 family)
LPVPHSDEAAITIQKDSIVSHSLNLRPNLLLLAAALVVLAAPAANAQTRPPAASAQPVPAQGGTAAHGDKFGAESVKKDFKFEVVSIRPVSPQSTAERPGPTPDGFDAQIPLYNMIMLAYAPEEFLAWLNGPTRISNPPQSIWDHYEINARVADEDREAWRNQGNRHELLSSALRDVLKERFKLVIHEHPGEFPGLHLVTMGKGVKLKATPPGFVLPPGGALRSGGVTVSEAAFRWHYYGASMEDLAAFLSFNTRLPVQDSTGLTGRYDFVIQRISDPSSDYNGVLDNWPIGQLGLALKPGKVPGRTLIIDHIEKPTEN